jgi:hypothetical protein
MKCLFDFDFDGILLVRNLSFEFFQEVWPLACKKKKSLLLHINLINQQNKATSIALSEIRPLTPQLRD